MECRLVDILKTTILMSDLRVKSLELFWRLDSRKFAGRLDGLIVENECWSSRTVDISKFNFTSKKYP